MIKQSKVNFRHAPLLAAALIGVTFGTVTLTQPAASAPAAAEQQRQVVGNKRSHIYRLLGAGHLPSKKNRAYFATEADAQTAGHHRTGVDQPKGDVSQDDATIIGVLTNIEPRTSSKPSRLSKKDRRTVAGMEAGARRLLAKTEVPENAHGH